MKPILRDSIFYRIVHLGSEGRCNKIPALYFSRMGTESAVEWHSLCLFLRYKRHNVMTQEGKGKTKQSRVATLIERIDAKFIAAGLGGKSVQLEPDPTCHRIIVRMPRQQKA